MTAPSRLPPLPADQVQDPNLIATLVRAQELSTPQPAWYLTLAHNPAVANAYASFWEATHREGTIAHVTKELVRITVARLLGCDFCADQRSHLALQQGMGEGEVAACMLPDSPSLDERTRIALRFARAMVAESTPEVQWDDIYLQLRGLYTDAEVVELGCFVALAIGGVKLSRSLRIDP